MKKVIIPMAIVAITSLAIADDKAALQAQIDDLKAQIAELKSIQKVASEKSESMQREITAVKKHDSMDNIKFSADLRTAYDIVDYKVSKSMRSSLGDVKSNGIWTNKLILGMSAQPLDSLIFRGSLAAYKGFGNNNAFAMNPYQAMDWYGTNSPSDSKIRLREAYFLYMTKFGDLGFTASLGRRPSLDGFLTNFREYNDSPNSPTGHNINMEFDGASLKFDFDKLTSISGLYFKLCLGRGNSNVDAKYPAFTNSPALMGTQNGATMGNASLPYSDSKTDSPDMDLVGIIAQLYDDGQYKVMLNYFQAWNVMGANFALMNQPSQTVPPIYGVTMTDVGDLTGGSLGIQISGIGDEWSDFLDDTIFFASVAFSKTDPKGTHSVINPQNGQTVAVTEMLGTSDSKVGTSYYVGVNMPGFMENDRIGLEYNHGSKYWRSFTYGEDTLVGSKLATRGNAYEAYYNFPILGKYLTGQLRYTYIDYDYTGSNMFFGSTGTPMDKAQANANGMDFVDSASEIRLSLRYRY